MIQQDSMQKDIIRKIQFGKLVRIFQDVRYNDNFTLGRSWIHLGRSWNATGALQKKSGALVHGAPRPRGDTTVTHPKARGNVIDVQRHALPRGVGRTDMGVPGGDGALVFQHPPTGHSPQLITITYLLVKSTNCKPRSTQGMLKTTHSGEQSQVELDIELPGSNFCILSNAQNDDGYFGRNKAAFLHLPKMQFRNIHVYQMRPETIV